MEVDVRRRLDLAVEDDREVLEEVLAVAEEARPRSAALGLLARDRVEDLRALLRELHGHDRLVRVGVEVLPRARELQLVPGHLGDAGIEVVLEEVEVGRHDGSGLADARTA